ncbi:MAG TPA: LptF/LptG family permease, partial [Phycisphaerales bacterium]|nr:LptF/LptG family permease [Phycisphaerales bacterium]
SPLILWRHITAELWRLLLLTVAVLVTVIAFAAAVKPLADGKLGPAEAIKFMVLAVPPMLAYALPFSAGFAATLAYHRMAQDNELLAAHSGGIAHRSLLVPAFATGLALFLTLASLNEYIIPRFLRSMERLIARDLTKLMVSNIEQGRAVEHNNLMVYADDVVVPDAATRGALRDRGIADALELRRVVFIDTDSEGRVKNSVVVGKAEVYVIPNPEADGRSERVASVVVRDGVGWREDGTVVRSTDIDPFALPIPDAFHDDPKFLTWGELRALRDHPDRMDFVHARTRTLAYALAQGATQSAIRTDLRTTGQVKLVTPGGETMVIRARDAQWSNELERWVLLADPASGAIEIEWWKLGPDGSAGGGGITRIVPREAHFPRPIVHDQVDGQVTVRLELLDARVDSSATDVGEDIAAEGGSRRAELVIEGLRLVYDPLAEFLQKPAYELLAIAEPRIAQRDGAGPLAEPAAELRGELAKLQREITSKQNERWALAASCLIMVITGAVTAVRLRDSQPLAVYLWSFFPALGAVITVMGGQQLTHDSGAPGLFLLWGGVAALGAYTFLTFLGIRKH